jgi:hypothetical protein
MNHSFAFAFAVEGNRFQMGTKNSNILRAFTNSADAWACNTTIHCANKRYSANTS